MKHVQLGLADILNQDLMKFKYRQTKSPNVKKAIDEVQFYTFDDL